MLEIEVVVAVDAACNSRGAIGSCLSASIRLLAPYGQRQPVGDRACRDPTSVSVNRYMLFQ
jgi:hypothetical protein